MLAENGQMRWSVCPGKQKCAGEWRPIKQKAEDITPAELLRLCAICVLMFRSQTGRLLVSSIVLDSAVNQYISLHALSSLPAFSMPTT